MRKGDQVMAVENRDMQCLASKLHLLQAPEELFLLRRNGKASHDQNTIGSGFPRLVSLPASTSFRLGSNSCDVVLATSFCLSSKETPMPYAHHGQPRPFVLHQRDMTDAQIDRFLVLRRGSTSGAIRRWKTTEVDPKPGKQNPKGEG